MQHTCKLAMAQMRMTDSIEENLQKSLNFCDEAADSDLLFFPEIQLSPFFHNTKSETRISGACRRVRRNRSPWWCIQAATLS